jgi:membrane protein DedA with SNARE-associated domain/membrane-associated phospholipid phosphatase
VIGTIVERLLHLHGAAALTLVFLLPALEASAFIGFLFPGEIAVILGGVLASQGRFPLVAAIAAAVVGAFVGDSVGYAIGRKYGRRLLQGTIGQIPLVRRRLEFELAKAEAFLLRRGAWAVIIGRLTAVLRVLVPGLAGMARMPYGRFVVANGAGALLWGTGFAVAGYAAGNSWEHVQAWAGSAGLAFMGALVVGFVVTRVILGRRRRREEMERAAVVMGLEPREVFPAPTGIGGVPQRAAVSAGAVDGKAGRTADGREPPEPGAGWFRRRLVARDPLGLPLTVSVVAMAAAAWAFSGLLVQVLQQDVTRFDSRSLQLLVDHRTAFATGSLKAMTWLGSGVVIAPLAALAAGYLVLGRRDWRGALAVAFAYAGAVLWSNVVKAAVDRPRPPATLRLVEVTGSSFPSGHATQAAAFYGMVVLVLTVRRSVGMRIAAWSAALVIVGVVGLSRVYLGVHWPSDVLGGYALGAMWIAVLALALLLSRPRSLRRTGPPREAERGDAPASAPGDGG